MLQLVNSGTCSSKLRKQDLVLIILKDDTTHVKYARATNHYKSIISNGNKNN